MAIDKEHRVVGCVQRLGCRGPPECPLYKGGKNALAPYISEFQEVPGNTKREDNVIDGETMHYQFKLKDDDVGGSLHMEKHVEGFCECKFYFNQNSTVANESAEALDWALFGEVTRLSPRGK